MHWTPPLGLSAREQKICARLTRQRRFFPFLRRVRHRLFDADFQERLASMYSDNPRGNPPRRYIWTNNLNVDNHILCRVTVRGSR